MATNKKAKEEAVPDSAFVGGPKGPIDQDVKPVGSSRTGDPTAGEVALVNEHGVIDGSQGEAPSAPSAPQVAEVYVCNLTFDYNSKGGTNSEPTRAMKGSQLKHGVDISPEDAKVFVRLGYISPA